MKKYWILLLAFVLVVPVLAQVPLPPMFLKIPFWHWPTLYDTAENLVIKRGVGLDGEVNDKVYLRIGWGPCLAVFVDEFDALVAASPEDRYINMRDYAVEQLGAQGTWGEEDSWNCPKEPEDGGDILEYRWTTIEGTITG